MFARAAVRSSRCLQTSALCRTQVQNVRQYAVGMNEDVRTKLTEDLKAAMKAKDATTATIIRSTLAEVYAADKKEQKIVETFYIQILIAKLITRRREAAKLYRTGNRMELAEKEILEIPVLEAYLPPQLPQEEVDRLLQEEFAASEITPGSQRRAGDIGAISARFFRKVDFLSVDRQYVRTKIKKMLDAQANAT